MVPARGPKPSASARRRRVGTVLPTTPGRAGKGNATRVSPPVWERFSWTAEVMNHKRPAPADGGAGAGRWLWATGRDIRRSQRMAVSTVSATPNVNRRGSPGRVETPWLDRPCRSPTKAGARPGGREAPAFAGAVAGRWPLGPSARTNNQASAWKGQRPLPLRPLIQPPALQAIPSFSRRAALSRAKSSPAW